MADAVETTEEVEEVPEDVEEQEAPQDPTEGLRKALQAERKARKEAERKAREALAARPEPEVDAIEAARREAAAEATRTISSRIVQAEVKAALAGKVANPARVLRLIDTSDVAVGDDGVVDETDVEDAITAFLEEYPEFRTGSTRSSGSADQFTKGRQPAKPEKPNPNDLLRAALKSD